VVDSFKSKKIISWLMDGWPGITYRVNCMAYLSYIIYLLLILYWLLSCIIF